MEEIRLLCVLLLCAVVTSYHVAFPWTSNLTSYTDGVVPADLNVQLVGNIYQNFGGSSVPVFQYLSPYNGLRVLVPGGTDYAGSYSNNDYIAFNFNSPTGRPFTISQVSVQCHGGGGKGVFFRTDFGGGAFTSGSTAGIDCSGGGWNLPTLSSTGWGPATDINVRVYYYGNSATILTRYLEFTLLDQCVSPADPPNGFYTGSLVLDSLTTNLTCNYGYQISGTPQTCSNGNLQGTAPSCTATPCVSPAAPPDVTFGAYTCAASTPGNTSCPFSCISGYQQSGSLSVCFAGTFQAATVACNVIPCTINLGSGVLIGNCAGIQTGGNCDLACDPNFDQTGSGTGATCDGTAPGAVQFNTGIVCTARPCSSMPNPVVNGTYSCPSQANNTRCTLSCNWGFTQSGVEPLCKFGSYIGPDPVCNALTCSTSSLASGVIPGTCTGVTAGNGCVLACDPNFDMTGTPNAICQVLGQSSVAITQPNPGITCTAKQCLTAPPTVTFGSYNCASAPNNTRCTLTCNSGYTKTGTEPLCKFGTWIGANPTCSDVACSVPSFPTGVSSTCAGIRTGGICTVFCQSGYNITFGSTVANCTGTGPGTVVFNYGITCSPAPCTAPPSPVSHLTWTCTGANSGQTCAFTCDPGYGPSGTTTCTRAVFSGNAACTAVSCGNLGTLGGGRTSNCNGITTGNSCALSCLTNWTGSGDPTIQCNGVSQGVSAYNIGSSTYTCSQNPCSVPIVGVPVGGSYAPPCNSAGTVQSGTTCPFSCAFGYTKTGVDPSCYAAVFNTTQNVGCTPANCASLGSITGVDNNCGTAPTTSTCVYQCSSGYHRTDIVGGIGKIFPICTGTAPGVSSWDTQSFTCGPNPCLNNPVATSNGNYPNCVGQADGTLCDLQCNIGYAESGVDPTCTRGNWTTTPTCVGGQCLGTGYQGFSPALSGSMTAGTCTGAAKAIGSSCDLTCINGYVQTGTTTTTCTVTGSAGAGQVYYPNNIVCTLATCAQSSIVLTAGIVYNNCVYNSQTMGQTCDLRCRDGYYVGSGSVTATCTAIANGAVYQHNLVCKPSQCTNPFPSLGPNQQLGNCSSQTLNTDQTCELKCDIGYGPVNNTAYTVRCQPDSGAITSSYSKNLICGVIPCTLPALGTNVNRGDCPSTQIIGEACTLGCDPGSYLSQGKFGANCTSLGGLLMAYNFSLTCSLSVCQPVRLGVGMGYNLCPSVPTQTTGQQCDLICNPGYGLVAGTSPTAKCTAPNPGDIGYPTNSTYVKNTQCQLLYCAAPIPGANQNLGNCTDGTLSISQTCYMGCNDGFFLHLPGNPTALCNYAGNNAVAFQFSYSCDASTCSLPALDTGSYAGVLAGNCSNAVKTNQQCLLQCKPGYATQNNPVASCLPRTGTKFADYSISIHCDPYHCPLPTALTRGQSTGNCSSVQIVGDACTMGCRDGYSRSSGNFYSYCAVSSPTTVDYVYSYACSPATCSRPNFGDLILNGTCLTNHTTDETCTLECVAGYQASSSTSYQATCSGVSGSVKSAMTYNLVCVDINECAASNGGCDAHADCFNTVGSFYCSCQSMFVGDGRSCTASPATITATVLSFDLWVPTTVVSVPASLTLFESQLPYVLTQTLLAGHSIPPKDVHISSVSVTGITSPPTALTCPSTQSAYTTVSFQIAVETVLTDWTWFTGAVSQWQTCSEATVFGVWTNGAEFASSGSPLVQAAGGLSLCADGTFQGQCPGGGGGSSAGAIAGAIIAILVVGAAVGLGYYYWKKRQQRLARVLDGVGSEMSTKPKTAATDDEESTNSSVPARPPAPTPAPAPVRASSDVSKPPPPATPARQGTTGGSAKPSAPSPVAKAGAAGAAGAAAKARDFSTLALLLADPIGLAAFQAYLKKEMSAENLDFWLAVEEYRKTKQELCKTMSPTEKPLRQAMKPVATKIFTRYMAQTVDSTQVNVPEDVDARTKNRLRQHFDLGVDQEYGDPSKTLFDEAQEVIFKLMETDSFGRFQKTPEFNRARNAK